MAKAPAWHLNEGRLGLAGAVMQSYLMQGAVMAASKAQQANGVSNGAKDSGSGAPGADAAEGPDCTSSSSSASGEGWTPDRPVGQDVADENRDALQDAGLIRPDLDAAQVPEFCPQGSGSSQGRRNSMSDLVSQPQAADSSQKPPENFQRQLSDGCKPNNDEFERQSSERSSPSPQTFAQKKSKLKTKLSAALIRISEEKKREEAGKADCADPLSATAERQTSLSVEQIGKLSKALHHADERASEDVASRQKRLLEQATGLWQRASNHVAKRTSVVVAAVDDAAMFKREEDKANNEPFKFTDEQLVRIEMRLDGWESYSVLGALIAGFALSIISSVELDDFDRIPWIVCVLFTLCATLSTFAGLYTAIVFALCGLYGKSGIGMNKDEHYIKFISETAVYRGTGFKAFMAGPPLLFASLLLLLFVKIPVSVAFTVNAISFIFVWRTYGHIRVIMNIATKHIFAPTPVTAQEKNK